MRNIVYLHNSVRNYAWGDAGALHELLDVPNPNGEPQAELWLGAYGKSGSLVKKGDKLVPLAALIAKNPEIALGESEALKYDNKLPFLFKVIAVNKPLSLQIHPNREQARVGFARENLLEIGLEDAGRNYKDAEGKSEIVHALGDFWLVCGFRGPEDTAEFLRVLIPGAIETHNFDLQNTKGLFAALMGLSAKEKTALCREALGNLAKLGAPDEITWIETLSKYYPDDPAILAPVLLNLVKLNAGETLFIPSRTVHAYLKGVGLELCSASDNTMRAGLTAKHVDLQEFITAADFSAAMPRMVAPQTLSPQETLFGVAGEAYGLSKVELPVNGQIHQKKHQTAEIILCMEGEFDLMRPGRKTGLTMVKGQAMFVPHSVDGLNVKGKGVLYKAFIA